MVVNTILILRHAHRIAWTLDPTTGKYTSQHPFPTRLPADPPLASHGVDQAEETGRYLAELLSPLAQQDRLRIYSSLFYRCFQTLKPLVERLRGEGTEREDVNAETEGAKAGVLVRGEAGLGEWFGKAWFDQPVPAGASRLKREFFPWVDGSYKSLLVPSRKGERMVELHDRVARALHRVVADIDHEYEEAGREKEEVTLLICGHAAQIICAGRALTGQVPEDLDEDDFQCYTCGISRFQRRQTGKEFREEDWRAEGVMGGWECVDNSATGHLSEGAERGWQFHGDEDFDSYTGPVGDSGFGDEAPRSTSKL